MEEMKEILCEIKKQQNEIQQQQIEMKESIARLEEKQEKGFREVNQRAAIFQEEITAKVNILLDADITRQELLDIHDSEITELREEQFKHSVRISNLETKVVGA